MRHLLRRRAPFPDTQNLPHGFPVRHHAAFVLVEFPDDAFGAKVEWPENVRIGHEFLPVVTVVDNEAPVAPDHAVRRFKIFRGRGAVHESVRDYRRRDFTICGTNGRRDSSRLEAMFGR
jgi:hypothetical protein